MKLHAQTRWISLFNEVYGYCLLHGAPLSRKTFLNTGKDKTKIEFLVLQVLVQNAGNMKIQDDLSSPKLAIPEQ